MFCPMTKKECRKDCAWFVREECAIMRLHDIAEKAEELTDIVGCLDQLEQTIKNI